MNQFGYRDFRLGDFSFRRDEYFAHIEWPGGTHTVPVDKFLKALTEAIDYVKTDLMPDFDFDAYNHDNVQENDGSLQENGNGSSSQIADDIIEEVRHTPTVSVAPSTPTTSGEEVDKW